MPTLDTTVTTPGSYKGVQRHWENSPRDAQGQLVLRTNPLTERWWDCKFKQSSFTWPYYKSNCTTRWGTGSYFASTQRQFDPQIYATGSWPNSIEAKAAWKFYQELTDVKLSIGQMLAERQQTVNLIANRVGSIYRAYRSLRKGRNPFRGGARVRPKDAPNHWLEYSYGWVPLVQDVHDALEFNSNNEPIVHLAKRVRQRRKFVRISGVSRGNVYWTTTTDFTQVHRVSVGADIKIANPTLGFLTQFDISNPASLAWDLMPYSFVVDWFIPVGDWLRMQQARVGVTFVNPYTVHKSYIRYVSKVVGDGDACRTQDFFALLGPEHSECGWKNRAKRLPGIPPLEVDVNLNINKAISGLALMAQIFGRKRDSVNSAVSYEDYVKLTS